jgi:hypothetical protein
MDRARDGVDDGERPVDAHGTRVLPSRGVRATSLVLTAATVLAMATIVSAQARRSAPKPSPSPDPIVGQMENVVAELRGINVTLGALRAELADLGERLDRVELAAAEIKGVASPMREEVRGLYVETSNVRSEIARLEQKSIAEAQSLGKSRYVLTLLLVATAVLQLVVLAVLLRSR